MGIIASGWGKFFSMGWFCWESFGDLGSFGEVVLVWVLLGKLCWFGFFWGSCAGLGSLGEVVLIWVSWGSCADLGLMGKLC